MKARIRYRSNERIVRGQLLSRRAPLPFPPPNERKEGHIIFLTKTWYYFFNLSACEELTKRTVVTVSQQIPLCLKQTNQRNSRRLLAYRSQIRQSHQSNRSFHHTQMPEEYIHQRGTGTRQLHKWWVSWWSLEIKNKTVSGCRSKHFNIP